MLVVDGIQWQGKKWKKEINCPSHRSEVLRKHDEERVATATIEVTTPQWICVETLKRSLFA